MIDEKQKKKALSQLKVSQNIVRSAWAFGQLKDWGDVYRKIGYPESFIREQTNSKNGLVYPELQDFLAKQKEELERSFNNVISQSNEEVIETVATKKEEKVGEVGVQLGPRDEGVGTTVSKNNGEQKQAEQALHQLPSPQLLHNNVSSDESALSNDNNYGLMPITTWKAFHYWFQKKAIKEALDKILGFDVAQCSSFEELREKYFDPCFPKKPKSGLLILSGTGTGKTYIVAAIARVLWDLLYHEGKTWSHIPYLWITKTTVIEQASRVLKNTYNLEPTNDVEVVNIESLRSRGGQLWLKADVKVQDGEEVVDWNWKPNINPCVVFFDESQGAKNSGSTQSQIMCNYSRLRKNATLVSVSATPFTRVSEAKCFAISTHRPLRHMPGFPPGAVLDENTWPSYAAQIAHPDKPTEYNQAAIERLMKDLDDYVVRVRNVRSQFNAKNGVRVIPFESQEKYDFYFAAWTRFCEKKAKLDALKEAGEVSAGDCMFVILQQFSMAAELCHAEGIAKKMWEDVYVHGKAACCAVKWKGTIIEITKILHDKYGVSRDLISLVWGGGQTQLTKKQKDKAKIIALDEKLKAMGLSADEMLVDAGLDDVEDRYIQELPAHLRLGAQSMDERQVEIDKFQTGKSLFCMYTFKSGGVGLSLHHCDEATTQWDTTAKGYAEWKLEIDEWNKHRSPDKQVKPGKCRRKESGYAFEQDIPFIPVRPRRNHVFLTYNAIELVQGVGRCPRLTSLSDTEQYVYAYEGTVEVDIGNIVSQKLRCLTSVVKQKESWQDVIMGGSNTSARAQKVKELIATTEGVKDEDATMIEEGEED